jgi:hypothetical protein
MHVRSYTQVNLGLSADDARVQNPDKLGQLEMQLGSNAALVRKSSVVAVACMHSSHVYRQR